MANIFVKYPDSFRCVSKAELTALLTRTGMEVAISRLPSEKQARVFAGEKIVVRVRAGTRTRLIKYRWAKPTSPYTTENAPRWCDTCGTWHD